MRKLWPLLVCILALPLAAQVSNPSIILVATAPSGACSAGLPNQQVASTGALYSCQSGTWGQIGASVSSGFPITLGSTPIAASSTTTALTGLSVNGVTLNAAGSTSLFLNQAGGYATPTGAVTRIIPGNNTILSPSGGTGNVTINSTGRSAVLVTDPPYNAVCDGTTDDHVAIQAALDSTAVVINLPSSSLTNYSLCSVGTVGITVPDKSNGDGDTVAILRGNGSGIGYQGTGRAITMQARTTIDNTDVDMTGSSGSPTGIDCTQCTIQNGVNIYSGPVGYQSVAVDSGKIIDSGGDGTLYITGGGAFVQGVSFNYGGANDYGIEIQGVSNSVVIEKTAADIQGTVANFYVDGFSGSVNITGSCDGSGPICLLESSAAHTGQLNADLGAGSYSGTWVSGLTQGIVKYNNGSPHTLSAGVEICNGTLGTCASGSVTSVTFTGDGVIDSATPSTAVTTSGTVTATLLNAAAHKWLGNNTGSTAAPGYQSIGAADLPVALSNSTSVNGTTIPASSTLAIAAVSNAITSATPGAGITSVTCATASCTNLRGSYTVVGGAATTGTIITLVWPTTTTAYVCSVTQNDTGVATAYLGLGHSVATATGMTISAGISVIGTTFVVDYQCQP